MRSSSVVGSDETSARVAGKTWWQWVLLGSTAIYHVIADTRAASVVTTLLDGARPQVWVADRYGGQLGHGVVRQMCLAHLLRDAKYAIEEGDVGFALGFHFLLLQAVAVETVQNLGGEQSRHLTWAGMIRLSLRSDPISRSDQWPADPPPFGRSRVSVR
jgi:hypothetical protein